MENGKRRLVICSQNKKRKLEKSVPWDLVPDILSRLPAKDLIRFACVSKSWRSLIRTDPSFHRLQAQRTDRQKLFLHIEVKTLVDTYFVSNNHWVDFNSIQGNPSSFDFESIDFESIEERHSINNPFDGHGGEPPRRDNLVLGSCHGLLLHQQQRTMKLAVSNPTTKKHVMLPFNPAYDVNAVFCGFGYDRVHDCYKVVFKDSQLLELMVYDLTKGSWGSLRFGAWWRESYRAFRDISDWVQDDDKRLNYGWNEYSAECVDGAVYWCVCNIDRQREMMRIVCFLLAEQEFHRVDPPELDPDIIYYPNLTVMDERLCLVCRASDNSKIEVFSRTGVDYDDDGYRQSWWIKLFAMSGPYDVLSGGPSYHFALHPVCFSACRNKILVVVGYGQLFWYDLDKEEFSKFSNLIEDSLTVKLCVSRMGDLGFLLKNTL